LRGSTSTSVTHFDRVEEILGVARDSSLLRCWLPRQNWDDPTPVADARFRH